MTELLTLPIPVLSQHRCLQDPELIESSKTYRMTCPKCLTPKSLRAKVSGKIDKPGRIEWNVVCTACDYQEGWYQEGMTRWTAK